MYGLLFSILTCLKNYGEGTKEKSEEKHFSDKKERYFTISIDKSTHRRVEISFKFKIYTQISISKQGILLTSMEMFQLNSINLITVVRLMLRKSRNREERENTA